MLIASLPYIPTYAPSLEPMPPYKPIYEFTEFLKTNGLLSPGPNTYRVAPELKFNKSKFTSCPQTFIVKKAVIVSKRDFLIVLDF